MRKALLLSSAKALSPAALLAALLVPALALADAHTTPPPPPVDGGRIGTIEVGAYACETPGDATSDVGKPYPQLSFLVINASSYRRAGQRGSYLLTGRMMTMTDGPLKGTRFRHVSRTKVQLLDDQGRVTDIRCVRSGPSF